MSMKRVCEVINGMRNLKGTNDKLCALGINDTPLLREVLFYTYNPYYKYKISEKMIGPIYDKESPFDNIFDVLDVLRVNNINKELRDSVNAFLTAQDNDLRDLYIGMITKNLKIGLNSTSINKVYEGLIPQFNIQLAETYDDDKTLSVNIFDSTITPKLDGHRVLIFKDNNEATCYTRQGKEYGYLGDFTTLPNGYVYDGEILLDNGTLAGNHYQEIARALKKGSNQGLRVVLFDCIPIQEFVTQSESAEYKERIRFLQDYAPEYVIPILHSGAITKPQLAEIHAEQVAKGYEGIMINNNTSPYKFKRSCALMKYKQFKTADVLVKSIIEGTGRNKGKLGAVEIEFKFKGQTYTCNCGSGFTDFDREYFYINPRAIVGKVIEIQYFEITQNQNGGYGFRFPTYLHIREDKSAKDLNI